MPQNATCSMTPHLTYDGKHLRIVQRIDHEETDVFDDFTRQPSITENLVAVQFFFRTV